VTDRILNVINRVKEIALKCSPTELDLKFRVTSDQEKAKVAEYKIEDLLGMEIHIESHNNFNTAAGLASSSSGLSCLGVALASLYGLPADKVDFSQLARIGSGSAVRSVYGGFVVWNKGYD